MSTENTQEAVTAEVKTQAPAPTPTPTPEVKTQAPAPGTPEFAAWAWEHRNG